MLPKISILISTYNGEKKVKRAVFSALRQTYENIEIICLDDCSTDNTYKILLELQRIDKRIKVFKNKTNLGIARNRNLLINYATGEYFTFLDDDDTLTKHICKEFISKLGTRKIDIAPFKARIIFYSFFVMPWFCTSKINKKTNQYEYVNSSLCPPWGCFINKKYFNSLNTPFNEKTRRFEDVGLMPYVYFCAKEFMPLNKTGYNYYKDNSHGRLSSYNNQNATILSDEIYQVDRLLTIFKKKGFLNRKKFLRIIWSNIEQSIGCYIGHFKPSKKYSEKLIYEKIKMEYKYLMHIKYKIPTNLKHNIWWKKIDVLFQNREYKQQNKKINQILKK